MKTMRNLFLLCAGLSLFACSSDDDATQQFPEGKGAVTIKIANPSSRAISGASTSQVVNGDITLTVVHSNGTSTATLKYDTENKTYTDQVVDDSYTDMGDVTANGNELTYTFYGIGTPSLVSASMYGGVASYDDVAIIGGTPELQVTPNQIPVYGEIKSFGTGDPIAKSGVTYRQYTAAVTMTIPVARMEVNVEVGDMSTFGSVKLFGVYLDKIKPTGNGAITNYYLEGDQSDTKQATGSDAAAYAILKDSYTGSPITLTDGIFLPADVDSKKQYFAYNFYAETNPEFKLLLQVEQKTGQATIPTYQYAILKDFNTTFANQNIYQVNVVLNDENIQIDEEGANIQYALTATVTKASWTAVSVTGQWGQGSTEYQQ